MMAVIRPFITVEDHLKIIDLEGRETWGQKWEGMEGWREWVWEWEAGRG